MPKAKREKPDAAFLRAIEEKPLDAVAHGAYADWLDEDGRPEEADLHRRVMNGDAVVPNEAAKVIAQALGFRWSFQKPGQRGRKKPGVFRIRCLYPDEPVRPSAEDHEGLTPDERDQAFPAWHRDYDAWIKHAVFDAGLKLDNTYPNPSEPGADGRKVSQVYTWSIPWLTRSMTEKAMIAVAETDQRSRREDGPAFVEGWELRPWDTMGWQLYREKCAAALNDAARNQKVLAALGQYAKFVKLTPPQDVESTAPMFTVAVYFDARDVPKKKGA